MRGAFGLEFQTKKINLAAWSYWYFKNPFFSWASRHDITVQKVQYGSSGSQNLSLILRFEACWQHLSQNEQDWQLSKSWSSAVKGSVKVQQQVQHSVLTWSPSYGNFYSICCYLQLVKTASWWLNLSQDISKTALCESLLLKFATMSHVRKTTLW